MEIERKERQTERNKSDNVYVLLSNSVMYIRSMIFWLMIWIINNLWIIYPTVQHASPRIKRLC